MLVVDDHPVVRHGITLVINAEPDLTVCGEAENEQAARRMLRELQPDALVVDLSLGAGGDGFNIVRDVHAHFPQLPILVLSMHDETVYADRLFAQGASGYIMKQAAAEQLVTALRVVLHRRALHERQPQDASCRARHRGRRTGRPTLGARAAGHQPDRHGPGYARDCRAPVAFGQDRRNPSA